MSIPYRPILEPECEFCGTRRNLALVEFEKKYLTLCPNCIRLTGLIQPARLNRDYPQTVGRLPIAKKKRRISRLPKDNPPKIGMSEPPRKAKVPSVDFSLQDHQDSVKLVTAKSVLKDYGDALVYKKRPRVYKSWIPTEDMPFPEFAEQMIGIDELDGYTEEDQEYPWEEFSFGSRAFPPVKIAVLPDEKIRILDGNHRTHYWTEVGMEYIPAWVLDYRR